MELNNCNYNCVKQLSKQLEFLWNLDGYLKDAKDCEHKDCEKLFEVMRKDTQKHIKALKGIIEKRVKQGEFH